MTFDSIQWEYPLVQWCPWKWNNSNKTSKCCLHSLSFTWVQPLTANSTLFEKKYNSSIFYFSLFKHFSKICIISSFFVYIEKNKPNINCKQKHSIHDWLNCLNFNIFFLVFTLVLLFSSNFFSSHLLQCSTSMCELVQKQQSFDEWSFFWWQFFFGCLLWVSLW